MSRRYGLYGDVSRDFLTHGGRILWHTDAAELEFLVPHGCRAVEIPRDVPAEQMVHISHHPQMASVRWPLDRRDFRRRTA